MFVILLVGAKGWQEGTWGGVGLLCDLIVTAITLTHVCANIHSTVTKGKPSGLSVLLKSHVLKQGQKIMVATH